MLKEYVLGLLSHRAHEHAFQIKQSDLFAVEKICHNESGFHFDLINLNQHDIIQKNQQTEYLKLKSLSIIYLKLNFLLSLFI